MRYTLDVTGHGCKVPRVKVQLRQEMQLPPPRQALNFRGATSGLGAARRCSNARCPSLLDAVEQPGERTAGAAAARTADGGYSYSTWPGSQGTAPHAHPTPLHPSRATGRAVARAVVSRAARAP